MSQSQIETPTTEWESESEGSDEGTVDRAMPDVEPPVGPKTAGGAIAGIGGVVSVVSGIRALRRGERALGLARLGLGAVFGAVALALGRSKEDTSEPSGPQAGEQSGTDAGEETGTTGDTGTADDDTGTADDDTGTADDDTGATDDEADVNREDEGTDEAGTGEEGTDEAETPADTGEESAQSAAAGSTAAEPGDAAAGDGIERDADAPAATAYDRLGEAAFDEHGSEVPAPQRAFNVGLLSHDAEAFWGVCDADDAVLVSHDFDALREADGVRYVGSSQIDGDRTLSVPDVVRDHWNDAAGGGTVVESGTGLTFATSEALRADGQLLVVPEHSVDDLLGE